MLWFQSLALSGVLFEPLVPPVGPLETLLRVLTNAASINDVLDGILGIDEQPPRLCVKAIEPLGGIK